MGNEDSLSKVIKTQKEADEFMRQLRNIMSDEQRKNILETYNWIKVPKYREADFRDPNVDWKSEYKSLLDHHKLETEFLINKIREMVK